MTTKNMNVYSKRKPNEIPQGAVYVGRPTDFGNPFTSRNLANTKAEFQADNVEDSINKYIEWITDPDQVELLSRARKELRGKSLVCWCSSPSKPALCHAHVLMNLVNQDCGEA